MRSDGVVDLRSKKSGGHLPTWNNPLPLREKPRSPLKARRRRVRAFFAFALLCALVAAGFGASWLSYHPRFAINDIDVSGVKDIEPEFLRTFVEKELFSGTNAFFSSSNMFLYPREQIEEAIAAYFPRVKAVEISRKALFAQAITVLIEERSAFARWCTDDLSSCYAIDESGYVFVPVGTTTSRFSTGYIFRGDIRDSDPVGDTYLRGRFSGVVALVNKLGQAGFVPQGVIAEDAQDFSVRLTDGLRLRLSYGGDVNAAVKNLELVLDSEALKGKRGQLEYIDLRFGNRVYFKLKGASAESKLENQ